MAREIANAFVFFLGLLTVIAIPALLLGYWGLANLDLISGGIIVFLTGFMVGLLKQEHLEDNITTIIISGLIIGFLYAFTVFSMPQIIGLYVVSYFIGHRLHKRHHHHF